MSRWPYDIAQLCKEYTGRVSIQKERVNQGGYIKGGVYFGVGEPLYFAQDEDGLWCDYFRASDRNEAIAIMRERYPNAQIKRSR